jgi:hypothetical protein
MVQREWCAAPTRYRRVKITRVKYALSASVLALAIAILIYALMPRYYLIVAPSDLPLIQMGPFATQASCERARQRLWDAALAAGDPNYAPPKRENVSGSMVCLSAR